MNFNESRHHLRSISQQATSNNLPVLCCFFGRSTSWGAFSSMILSWDSLRFTAAFLVGVLDLIDAICFVDILCAFDVICSFGAVFMCWFVCLCFFVADDFAVAADRLRFWLFLEFLDWLPICSILGLFGSGLLLLFLWCMTQPSSSPRC